MEEALHRVELLSPARDLACGMEAVRHGADAVYIGAPKFGARAAAGNSIDDIGRLCDGAHLFGVRVYVALNTLLKDGELLEAERLIVRLCAAGIDALIVQDMGILRLDIPPVPLHASTQTDNRTPEKVRFLESVGFSQVVLARELSLREIRRIADHTSVSLEVFVHGALCVSYSGQCYVSAALCGRSANRGECAQYCRLPYTLTDGEGRVIARDRHFLSLKDMNRSDGLEALLDAGVSSFKIEGRLKDVAYVKNITAWYRMKLDAALARRPDCRRASCGQSVYAFEPVPEKSFNRGFTPFFLYGRSVGVEAFDTPKSAGEPAGTVREAGRDSFTVSGPEPLHNGDGLTFFRPGGGLEGFRVNRVEGNRVFPASMPALRPGTALFRNVDHRFEKQLSGPSAERRIAVEMEFTDNPFGFTLCMTDETGLSVRLSAACTSEPALRDQEEYIVRQLSRLGNTPFAASSVKVSLSGKRFVPSPLLSEIRRRAADCLMLARRLRHRREEARWKNPPEALPYPERTLDCTGNVLNTKAEAFYRAHGVQEIAPAFESAPRKDVPWMYARHCLRYSMGWCRALQGKDSPYREPFYLLHGKTRLRLEFDCRQCRMLVFGE
ncbi:MAG: U32 family peptidase [Tannerellaceae bacterium]|jgi:putative protease|nr:U32 family peptidase [Tannerellaceae bacterium]